MIKSGIVKTNHALASPGTGESIAPHYQRSPYENDLVQRCLAGENEAQEELYKKFSDPMLKVCCRYLNDFHRAEDALQEGFVQAFRSLKYFKHQCALKTWMTRIFARTAIQLYRKDLKHKKREDNLDEVSDRIKISPNAEGNFEIQAITHIINQLPERARLVFVMYIVEGYTHKDIARELNICEGTSKSQLARAKAWVKKRISA